MKKLSLGITLAAIASFISFSAIAEEQDANTQFNGLFGVKLGSVMPASKICETNKENLLVYKYELDQDSKELKQFRDYDISRDVFFDDCVIFASPTSRKIVAIKGNAIAISNDHLKGKLHKIVSVLAKIAVLYGGEHKEEVKDGFYVAFPNGNHILVTFEPITVLGKALGGYIIYLSAAIGNDAFAEQKQSQKSNVDNHVQTRRENNLLSQLASDMVPIPGKDYAICKYEVTQALWEAVMGSNPSHFKGADLPVESFSWDECCQFIGKLNERGEIKASGCQYRLPTQEEWEFASLAGGDDKYPMAADGNHVSKQSVERIAWCAENSGDATHQVGQKEANAFGLYDVMGNVAELMYETTRKGVNYNSVVYSGGSWGDSKDGFLKIDMPMAFVSEWELGDGKNYVGIRLVRDVGDWMTAFKKNGNHRERE